MTMNPFEQSTQQLLRFLTSHAEWEVIDYIRQEIQHDAPDSVPTADELLTFFQSPDAPTELDTYQQMLVTDKLLLSAAQGIGRCPFRKGVHSALPSRRTGGHTMNQFPSKNYFTLPNEIFSLGLGAGEIAVYAYLRCLENPSTYQCWPSYATIGKAIGRTKNTVMQYVDALSEKGLISTEPTSVLTKSRIKKNGNLCYTIRPIHEAVEIFHTRQLSAVERTTERRQIHRKLSAVNLLPGA